MVVDASFVTPFRHHTRVVLITGGTTTTMATTTQQSLFPANLNVDVMRILSNQASTTTTPTTTTTITTTTSSPPPLSSIFSFTDDTSWIPEFLVNLVKWYIGGVTIAFVVLIVASIASYNIVTDLADRFVNRMMSDYPDFYTKLVNEFESSVDTENNELDDNRQAIVYAFPRNITLTLNCLLDDPNVGETILTQTFLTDMPSGMKVLLTEDDEEITEQEAKEMAHELVTTMKNNMESNRNK
jgi:hypothetical protein